MPLTPFHWSIVLLGILFFNTFYIPALAVSSVLMDLEPLYFHFLVPDPEGYIHRFFHTYIGVTILGLIVGIALIKGRKIVDQFMGFFKLDQRLVSSKLILFSSLIGAWSHVFFDSFLHKDIKPFWPIEVNPFLGKISVINVYLITGLMLFLVFAIYFWRLMKNFSPKKK